MKAPFRSAHSHTNRIRTTSVQVQTWLQQHLEIVFLYVIMFAGGLWHILGVLQTAMRLLAAPVIILLAMWLTFRYDQILRRTHNISSPNISNTARFHWWNLALGVSCFALEYIGVKTGVIFGVYSYTDVLIPAFNGVPVAIAFAWLGMMLCSVAVAQWITARYNQSPEWLIILIIAALMTVFDMFMEPLAVKLHYWQWLSPNGSFFVAPVQNYVVWFFNSALWAAVAVKIGVFVLPMPRIAFHAYWAQLLYFAMVALGA